MKKLILAVAVGSLVLLGFGAGIAYACDITGRVFCDVNQNGQLDDGDTPLAGVLVTLTADWGSGPVVNTAVTDSNGAYAIPIYDWPASYQLKIGPDGLPSDAVIVSPSSNPISFSNSWEQYPWANPFLTTDWLVDSATCRAAGCWLTGGGLKLEPIIGTYLAERGNKISFGGNVFPGCSPTSGEGGQWNNVDHGLKLHLQIWSFADVKCGNVSGIPPGSTSPVTPFNFLEASGTGTLKGISGNKSWMGMSLPIDPVYYFFRAEDRNEPGNEKASKPGGGAYIDRYFLNVFTNPADPVGSSIYLIDVDGDPATVDPVTITGGNLQIHISSCP